MRSCRCGTRSQARRSRASSSSRSHRVRSLSSLNNLNLGSCLRQPHSKWAILRIARRVARYLFTVAGLACPSSSVSFSFATTGVVIWSRDMSAPTKLVNRASVYTSLR